MRRCCPSSAGSSLRCYSVSVGVVGEFQPSKKLSRAHWTKKSRAMPLPGVFSRFLQTLREGSRGRSSNAREPQITPFPGMLQKERAKTLHSERFRSEKASEFQRSLEAPQN